MRTYEIVFISEMSIRSQNNEILPLFNQSIQI